MKNIIKYTSVVLAAALVLCACGQNAFVSGEDEVLVQLEGADSVLTDETAAYAETTDSAEAEQDLETVSASTSADVAQIYVYVCGAVKSAGVYSVARGSRLYEVVELAGGFTDDADETCLNLAREVQDGEQLVVLTKEERAMMPVQQAGQVMAEGSASAEGLVNINTATAAELTSISGIGASRAQAIIEYREKNGGFKSIDDIKKVDGIKDGLFSKIKDKITV